MKKIFSALLCLILATTCLFFSYGCEAKKYDSKEELDLAKKIGSCSETFNGALSYYDYSSKQLAIYDYISKELHSNIYNLKIENKTSKEIDLNELKDIIPETTLSITKSITLEQVDYSYTLTKNSNSLVYNSSTSLYVLFLGNSYTYFSIPNKVGEKISKGYFNYITSSNNYENFTLTTSYKYKIYYDYARNNKTYATTDLNEYFTASQELSLKYNKDKALLTFTTKALGEKESGTYYIEQVNGFNKYYKLTDGKWESITSAEFANVYPTSSSNITCFKPFYNSKLQSYYFEKTSSGCAIKDWKYILEYCKNSATQNNETKNFNFTFATGYFKLLVANGIAGGALTNINAEFKVNAENNVEVYGHATIKGSEAITNIGSTILNRPDEITI